MNYTNENLERLEIDLETQFDEKMQLHSSEVPHVSLVIKKGRKDEAEIHETLWSKWVNSIQVNGKFKNNFIHILDLNDVRNTLKHDERFYQSI